MTHSGGNPDAWPAGESTARGDTGDPSSWFRPSEDRHRAQTYYQDPYDDELSPQTRLGDGVGDEAISNGGVPSGAGMDSGPAWDIAAAEPLGMAEPYPDALGGPTLGAPLGRGTPGAGESQGQAGLTGDLPTWASPDPAPTSDPYGGASAGAPPAGPATPAAPMPPVTAHEFTSGYESQSPSAVPPLDGGRGETQGWVGSYDEGTSRFAYPDPGMPPHYGPSAASTTDSEGVSLSASSTQPPEFAGETFGGHTTAPPTDFQPQPLAPDAPHGFPTAQYSSAEQSHVDQPSGWGSTDREPEYPDYGRAAPAPDTAPPPSGNTWAFTRDSVESAMRSVDAERPWTPPTEPSYLESSTSSTSSGSFGAVGPVTGPDSQPFPAPDGNSWASPATGEGSWSESSVSSTGSFATTGPDSQPFPAPDGNPWTPPAAGAGPWAESGGLPGGSAWPAGGETTSSVNGAETSASSAPWPPGSVGDGAVESSTYPGLGSFSGGPSTGDWATPPWVTGETTSGHRVPDELSPETPWGATHSLSNTSTPTSSGADSWGEASALTSDTTYGSSPQSGGPGTAASDALGTDGAVYEGPSTQEFSTVGEFGEEDDYQPRRGETSWDAADLRDDAHDSAYGDDPSAEFDNRGSGRGLRARMGNGPLTDEFPDFDEAQGDDVVYPGYDNIASLPETAGTAKAVLGLGIASVLLFPLGLILGAVGLLLAPKARRGIRESGGELEGNGIVAAGAVLSCVGIVLFVVAVILAAIVLLF